MTPSKLSQTIALIRQCDLGKYADQTLVLAIAYTLPMVSNDENLKAIYMTHTPKIKKVLSAINELHAINIDYVFEQAFITYKKRICISYYPWASGTDVMKEIYDDMDDDTIADWDRAMKQLLAIFNECNFNG